MNPQPKDLVRLAMERAATRFGGTGRIFNSAGFGLEFTDLAGMVSRGIDGKLVEAILAGRPDVEVLHGGAHFRIVTEARP